MGFLSISNMDTECISGSKIKTDAVISSLPALTIMLTFLLGHLIQIKLKILNSENCPVLSNQQTQGGVSWFPV